MNDRPAEEGPGKGAGELSTRDGAAGEIREELLESMERYQIHFSLTRDVMYTIDASLCITSVSPSVHTVLGYTPDELVGKCFTEFEIMAPESVELALENAWKVLSGESRRGDILVYLAKNGERVYGEVSGVPLYRDGKVESIVSVARDITPRLKMQECLRQSEARFRAVFDTAQDCIFIKDRTLRYISVNAYMTHLLGLPEEKIIGQYDSDLFGAETGSFLRRIDLQVIAGEISREENALPIQGQTMTFHVVRVPMRDGSGEITGLCGIARNITERKRVEQELRAKEQQLELQAGNLAEINTALKVLLDHRDQERRKMQEDLVTRARTLIYPYLDKLGNEGLGARAGVYLEIVRANLDELITQYAQGTPSRYRELTPMEITVADLIKQGKTTKEIACLLNVSAHAVSFHRTNLRRKLGLDHRSVNLRSHLLNHEPGDGSDR